MGRGGGGASLRIYVSYIIILFLLGFCSFTQTGPRPHTKNNGKASITVLHWLQSVEILQPFAQNRITELRKA